MRKESSTNSLNEEAIITGCGMAYTLSLIEGRWKANILWQLLVHGTLRYSQLKKQIPDVSERMLSAQLRELENDQLVNRMVYPEVPPRVAYELSELGLSMHPMLESMSNWGDMHREWTDEEKKNR